MSNKGHDIKELVNTCLSLMVKIDFKGQFTDESITMTKALINFVKTFDKFGSFTFARYPLDSKNHY